MGRHGAEDTWAMRVALACVCYEPRIAKGDTPTPRSASVARPSTHQIKPRNAITQQQRAQKKVVGEEV